MLFFNFIYFKGSFSYFLERLEILYYFALFALSVKYQFLAFEDHKASSSN